VAWKVSYVDEGDSQTEPAGHAMTLRPSRMWTTRRLLIVMGSGYYVSAARPPDMDRQTVDQIARHLIADLTVGVGDTGIRAGLIGEIGCSWPFTDNEKEVVRGNLEADPRASPSVHEPLCAGAGLGTLCSHNVVGPSKTRQPTETKTSVRPTPQGCRTRAGICRAPMPMKCIEGQVGRRLLRAGGLARCRLTNTSPGEPQTHLPDAVTRGGCR
jgi:hypothetical protein